MTQARKALASVKGYAPPLEGRTKKLRLDFNENSLGPSPKVLKAIKNLSSDVISSYPEYDLFYEKLAKYLKIKRNQLIVTNGSDEAIKLIMEAYIEKDDEIIIPEPTFPIFRLYGSVMEAKMTSILYNKDLSFPLNAVLNAINDKTKIVVLVNPNNPTGTSIEKKDIIKIIEKAKNSLVIIDEAYVQFSKKTCIDLINRYDNLLILQTFSKAFGLAGLRIGYIASSEKNIKEISKVRPPYSVNTIAIAAASAALDDIKYMENYVNEVEKAKEFLYSELKELKIRTYSSSANFILAYFGDKSKEIQDKLGNRDILVRDRSTDPLLNGCVRISIGTLDQMKKFVKALKDILNE